MIQDISHHNQNMDNANYETNAFDIAMDQYIETPWHIIESYFKDEHLEKLVRHQLESYNNFVGHQIFKTIDMFNPVHIASEQDYDRNSKKYSLEVFVTFENLHVYRPQIHENNGAVKLMFPQEARLRNFTYASAMTIDINIKYVVRTGKELENTQTFYKVFSKIHIGKLPIMLKSNICVLNQYKHFNNTQTGECKYDSGGYFIINGSEKTVLGQERAAENRVYVFNISKNNTKYSWMAEIKSIPDFKCISPKQINLFLSSKNNGFGNAICVQIPRIKQPIPLFIVFRALGIISDKEICEIILLNIADSKNEEMLNMLQASVIEANKYLTQPEAIKYITGYSMFTPINMDKETGIQKKHQFTMDILNNDLFPHCSTPKQKIYFLGYMTHKLMLAFFRVIPQDDRDSYINKRVDLTGTLLNNLFRNYFNKLVKDMEKQVIKEINTGSWKSTDDYENIVNLTNIYKIIKSTTIENGLKRALGTGDFGVKNTNSNKVGVAQVLNRLTYVSSLSHARRISTPTDKSGKLIPPRKLHNTSWGFLCLTGDTEVLLSNRIDSKQIKDITDGNWVNTVNRETLMDEPSDMYNFFCKMPDKLYEIVTISGRKIKATSDHPFLVRISSGKYEMKKVSELQITDKVIIRHTVKHIPDENATTVIIKEDDIIDHYRMDLLEKNLLNVKLSNSKLKIIARLMGALNTDGHLGLGNEENNFNFDCIFNVKNQQDVYQLADDVKKLGFDDISVNKTETIYKVYKDGSFAYFMYLMGAFVEKKIRLLPEWLSNSELSIKREFLSSLHGDDYSIITCDNYLYDAIEYVKQIVKMFHALDINCCWNKMQLDNTKNKLFIIFENRNENLIRFSDYIHYAYSDEKRLKHATITEQLKIKEYNKDQFNVTQMLENFIKENIVDNGCVSVPILSIREIEPEMVYDFTTRSDNHSFVASSFVCSNCPAESPEGQSVGLVKNLSYMTHITIGSHSLPIYEYVMTNIQSIDDVANPQDIYDKVKVFINGSFVGITDTANELFLMLKDKKHKGILNIYTSIVFDYKMKEIRICNDGGRLTRPVLRVKNKNILITTDIINKLTRREITWNDLLTTKTLNETILEYIDPEEQSWGMIATNPKELFEKSSLQKFTHCEIHPSTIFGILGSCIPFPEHNQSPRNTYQCLDINETVLMSNGSSIKIKDVKIGDEVICFHPETMETSYTKVVYQYVRETDKKIYKITTLSGREIIATEDHKFMTTDGWLEVKDMVINDTKVGILPYQNSLHIMHTKCEENVILSEEDFKMFLTSKRFKDTLIDKYTNELTKLGLLPLYNTNYHLSILSRIFGFILADGSINIYERNGNVFTACSFDFGTEEDVKTFEKDIHLCGFNKCKYNKGSRQFNDVVHTTYSVTHNGALPALLLALGITYGRKTESIRKEIPSWIMNGSSLIKREFLSGFQGGDGCKIRWNKIDKGYNFICAETSQQINPKYEKSLISFMQQCILLLREFNIITSDVKHYKIEENRVKISYKISDKHSNLIDYYDNIGYRYASTKNNQSFAIVEYLKYKQTLFEEHRQKIDTVRKMYDENKTNTFIGNTLNIPVCAVSDIIRSYKNNRKISMRNLGNNTIDNWLQEVKIIDNILFIPIQSIELVSNRFVSDITVESENHSFIAGNNFLSSNCAQAKQAMGMYVTSFPDRMDKTAYVLNYPTRPLVDTRVMNMIQLNKIPSGTNVIVAIMTHTGYNQEDSLLINKGSIDRGMALVTVYHTEKDEDKQKINGDEEIRCRPDASKTKGMKMGNYTKVNSKGVMPENTLVQNRDVIIAKIIPIKENKNDHTKIIKYEDQSKIYKTNEETYIDKNYIDRNGEGYNFAKVRLRTMRKPVIGDKFSSRHGQKGTVGNIIPECDMPFTSNGVRPDIIINPHAIPSRMTIGQLKETLLGKVLIELGLFGDGTSFGQLDVKDICSELIKCGYESNGNELMYNGLTGEQHECSIFMGPVFYQRLKHMVNDKTHSRSIGPMVNLTRQPAEGRSRDGGLRFGEMERDCMISHGAARFTRGRMYDASDKYSVFTCKKCGLIAAYNDKNDVHHCKTCDNRVDFAYIEIPYACKLLFQELNTMNVVPRFITN